MPDVAITVDEAREISANLTIIRQALDGAARDLKDGDKDRWEDYKVAYLAALRNVHTFPITTYLTEDFDAEVAKAAPQPHIIAVVANDSPPFISGSVRKFVAAVLDGFGRPLPDEGVAWAFRVGGVPTNLNPVYADPKQRGITITLPTVSAPTQVSLQAIASNQRTGGTMITVMP
jgi:hypothetical protein